MDMENSEPSSKCPQNKEIPTRVDIIITDTRLSLIYHCPGQSKEASCHFRKQLFTLSWSIADLVTHSSPSIVLQSPSFRIQQRLHS